MFERLPFWGQVALFFGIAAVIVVLAYYVFPDLSAKEEKIQTLKDDYAEMERKILEGRAIEQKLPELEREIANLERKLGDIQQILPSTPETGDLLRWIKNLADQSNLDLESFVPGGMQPGEFYKKFPIEMEVEGRYHDMGIFMDRVSKYSRIINVDNLRMNATPAGTAKSIRAGFTATTFVYDEQAEKQQQQEVAQ
jgi:type IV pilus assembly protein PilO